MCARGSATVIELVLMDSEFMRGTKRMRVIALAFLLAALFAVGAERGEARGGAGHFDAEAQALPFTTSAVTIILPARLMAAHPATLAVFGPQGKLAPGVRVDLSDGESVQTDATGRARFTAPANATFLLARAEGTTAATLIDPASGASEQSVTIPPVLSLHEYFWLCGPSLQGDAGADHVSVSGRTALVLAASPECIDVLPPQDAAPGTAAISVRAPGVEWSASTNFVSLQFEAPRPALLPGQKGRLTIRVNGSTAKLDLVVENTSPDVLRFLRGDVQEVRTSGGASNSAWTEVQAIRSGDFSFHASIVPPPDTAIAARYLLAAAPYGEPKVQREVEKLARRLARNSDNVKSGRHELARLLNQAAPGDFRTLLSAGYSTL
jgi:hypothetical protein